MYICIWEKSILFSKQNLLSSASRHNADSDVGHRDIILILIRI